MGEGVRCSWVNLKNKKYVCYHDEEWGRPEHDDQKLYELLILESFQAGLSWECVLTPFARKSSIVLMAWRAFLPSSS